MSDITIPAAALEAGARALARYNCEQWDNDPDRWRAYFTDEARAAFLAMIEAWEGMRISWLASNDGAIVLPLTEASDDQ